MGRWGGVVGRWGGAVGRWGGAVGRWGGVVGRWGDAVGRQSRDGPAVRAVAGVENCGGAGQLPAGRPPGHAID